ncbi:MAG TPA: hypothetical protein VE734_07360, partial [Terriglobales bacterium]|nr:hypothetical protein [Terriglobales bacterium]
ALLLYALQIACSNLKNLRAEHPRPEAEDEQPKIVGRHKENTLNGKNCAELSVAELLVSLAAKGLTFDLDAPMPGLRSREDYDRVLEETPRSNPLPTASPGQETADEESGEGSGAPALPPEDGPVV